MHYIVLPGRISHSSAYFYFQIPNFKDRPRLITAVTAFYFSLRTDVRIFAQVLQDPTLILTLLWGVLLQRHYCIGYYIYQRIYCLLLTSVNCKQTSLHIAALNDSYSYIMRELLSVSTSCNLLCTALESYPNKQLPKVTLHRLVRCISNPQ